MTFVRRYGLNPLEDADGELRKKLENYHVKYSDKYMIVFEISEDNKFYNEILSAIEKCESKFKDKFYFTRYIKYTKKELDSAPYFHIYLKSYQGYLDETDYAHDYSKECPKCGSGIVQIKPFTFGRKFDISKKKVGGLFNAYDIFFFSEETVEQIKASGLTGFSFSQCINKKGESLPVYQLKPEEFFPYRCSFEVNQKGICPECGTERFCRKQDSMIEYNRNGEDYELKDCYYSKEWHGSGQLCLRLLYISQRAKKVFDQIGIKNLNYEPIFEVK